MTQEEKQLLLIDLCGRLPYFENWVQYEGKDYIVTGYGHGRVSLLQSVFSSIGGPCPLVEEIKPYLRPMSSMTEKEKNDYINTFTAMWDAVDWLNAHHFDYRGLIEKGLALEASEDMYKTE
jgi:hypothetical protein